jgi:hypothetical protein
LVGNDIRKSRVNGPNCKTDRLAPAHRVGECVIQIGESCFAILAEVMLPYASRMKTTHLKMFSELKVPENSVW